MWGAVVSAFSGAAVSAIQEGTDGKEGVDWGNVAADGLTSGLGGVGTGNAADLTSSFAGDGGSGDWMKLLMSSEDAGGGFGAGTFLDSGDQAQGSGTFGGIDTGALLGGTGQTEGQTGGILGGVLGGIDAGALLGGTGQGTVPDPIGLGQYADKGLDFLNETQIDKYAGGIAGAAAATYFTGGVATQQGWEVGSQLGDDAGSGVAGLNLFSDGETDSTA